MTIQSLIDKQDNFEIVRDQIAAILKTEVASQMILAAAALKDPELWDLQIYLEAFNPIDKWNDPKTGVNQAPIVNIWFDNASLDAKSSNPVSSQKYNNTFNIDLYGLGISKGTSEGHDPGDQVASFEVQRAYRLVRNILMSSIYTYLGLRGLVWKRMVQSITPFQPSIGDRPIQNVHGARIAFDVEFLEFSPQYEGETLETIATTIKRAEDGEVLFEAEYQYPQT